MKRASTAIVLATIVALTGCRDMGLEGNVPLQEAEQMAPPDLVAAVHGPAQDTAEPVILDGRTWVPWGEPQAMSAGALRPVGSVHGTTVYVRSWDRSPYDALFTATGDGAWQGHAPVIGQSGGSGLVQGAAPH